MEGLGVDRRTQRAFGKNLKNFSIEPGFEFVQYRLDKLSALVHESCRVVGTMLAEELLA